MTRLSLILDESDHRLASTAASLAGESLGDFLARLVVETAKTEIAYRLSLAPKPVEKPIGKPIETKAWTSTRDVAMRCYRLRLEGWTQARIAQEVLGDAKYQNRVSNMLKRLQARIDRGEISVHELTQESPE